MYNRYTCLLQPYSHLTLKFLIQGHPRSAKVTHIADFKSVYISVIIGPRVLQCETNLQEIMCCEFSDVVRFALGPLLPGQTRIAKLKKCVQLTDYWSFRFGMVNQHIGNHGLGIFWCGKILPWAPPSRSNEDSQT